MAKMVEYGKNGRKCELMKKTYEMLIFKRFQFFLRANVKRNRKAAKNAPKRKI